MGFSHHKSKKSNDCIWSLQKSRVYGATILIHNQKFTFLLFRSSHMILRTRDSVLLTEMRSLFSWQQTQSSSRNQYCPCAFFYQSYSLPLPSSVPASYWTCPEGVHKTVFSWAQCCRCATRPHHVETRSARFPHRKREKLFSQEPKHHVLPWLQRIIEPNSIGCTTNLY